MAIHGYGVCLPNPQSVGVRVHSPRIGPPAGHLALFSVWVGVQGFGIGFSIVTADLLAKAISAMFVE